MNNPVKIKVSEDDINERLDSFLSGYFDNFSRTQIQKIIENGKVLVDGNVKKSSYKLRENDTISVTIEETQKIEILPENIALDVRYEDENMLVVNKPKNMLTHPTYKEYSGTLVNALLGYCGQNLSDINGELRPGILHRLDRNTSGLLMVAKNNKIHENLAEQIKQRTVTKKYLAVVHGVIAQDSGTIDAPISRNPKSPEKMGVNPDGKPSVTEFKVLERFANHTFVDLNLITGRTHQIRVHLSSIGHPIVNDSLYSGHKFKAKTTEQVLQSYELTFKNPADNNIVNIKIEPDEDMAKTLTYLRSLR